MRLQQRLLIGLFTLAALMHGRPAPADSPARPRPYKVVSPGGKYVLVMLSPPSFDQGAAYWIEPVAKEIRDIRRTYRQSGLYRNDGSRVPLWTVDWYADGVYVAPDGIHLVRFGPWPVSLDEEAVSFFANGRLLHSYQIDELVDDPRQLPHSVSHFQWCKDSHFDDQRLEYTAWTHDGNRVVFDVRTGEIISKASLAKPVLGFVVVLVVGTVSLFAVVWLFAQWFGSARLATADP
jgi:hypothetical protein